MLNDITDLQDWYNQGHSNGATHLIVMFDVGYPFNAYYSYPGENELELQGQLEGGGHCWRVFDLAFPLSDKDITDFEGALKWADFQK